MKRRICLTLIIYSMTNFAAFGQSEIEISRLSSKQTFYLRNGIQIFPTFDKEGQICRAVLQPNRYSNNAVFVGNLLVSGELLMETLDVLAPAETRGERSDVWGVTLLLGQSYLTSYNYENVAVSLSGAINFGRMKASLGTSDEAKESSEDEVNSSVRKEGLPNSRNVQSGFNSSEVVTISWLKRDCSKN